MPKLMLDRQTLARLLQNDHQAIVAFEKVLGDVGDALPSTLEEVTALASMASALSNLVLAMLEKTDEQLELLRGLSTPVAPPIDESYIPAISFGTIGQQNADSVEITGGSIDGTTVGAVTASTGAFTTLTASGAVVLSPANANVVISPTGTGLVTINPATLGSMDKVAIGGTTPAAAAVTTLNATAAVTLSPANASVTLSPTGTGTVTIAPATAGTIDRVAVGATVQSTGAFTTLSATAAVALSPANANAVISPTGTGAVLMQPATAGNIDNINIGATTQQPGRFTTGRFNSTVTVDGVFLRIGTPVALAGSGGNLRLNDDTGTLRWLAGHLGSAGATAFSIFDVIAGATRMLVDAAGLATFNNGVTVAGGVLTTLGGASFHTTSTALTDNVGAAAGTLNNAPAAGDPTKWIAINDNGTIRKIPTWL